MTEIGDASKAEVIRASEDSLVIDVEFDPRICYALSYNERPPIQKVTIRNINRQLRGPAMITVSSEWTALGIPSIREMTKLSDLKEAGHAVEIEFRDSHLDDSAMAYLDQRVPADAIVTVTAERGYLFKYASETK